jgi:hypothetical protein
MVKVLKARCEKKYSKFLWYYTFHVSMFYVTLLCPVVPEIHVHMPIIYEN